ncbi:MAG: hypothetical protein WCO23_01415 [bacterium]
MHTSFAKGTPLFIKMRDGEILTGKFKDHKSGKVLLEDGRILEIGDVRSMSIRKLETSTSDNTKSKIKFRIDS